MPFNIMEQGLRLARPVPTRVRGRGVEARPRLERHRVAGDAPPHIPGGESVFTYAYFAIALFGAAMTPYEVFFFSSGAVEGRLEADRPRREQGQRLHRLPRSVVCWSLAIMVCASLVLAPRGIDVEQLSQVTLPVASSVGRLGLRSRSSASSRRRSAPRWRPRCRRATSSPSTSDGHGASTHVPGKATRFHLVVLVSIVIALVVGITGIDPVKVTEYSIVLSAAALPLTYFPILVIANDERYMGAEHTNGRFINALASVYLVILVIVAVVTIPLIIITKGGA